jgi:two-component system sensor histidine kinase TctE
LLRLVLLPLGAAVALGAVVTWRNADLNATAVQDQLLLGSARMIAEQLRFEDNAFQAGVPPAALELFESVAGDRVYYRVITKTGFLLTGADDMQPPPASVHVPRPRHFDSAMRGDAVRGVEVLQDVVGAPGDTPLVVQVAQTRHGHDALRQRMWAHAAAEQLLILALTGALIAWGLHRGLAPVRRLRDDVLARDAAAPQPLLAEGAPSELVPLVTALNEQIARVRAHTDAQRRFIEDAAHQLRTPLTLLNTQIGVAQRSTKAAERDEALEAIRRTLGQAIRGVNQLLTLSSAQAHQPHVRELKPVALDAIVQQVMEELAALAHARAIDLGFECAGTSPVVHAHPVMLREMVSNLLDNAIRYSPKGGAVTAQISTLAHGIELLIEDDGPGIPSALREKVFERFFRVADADSQGSGLGLAIVREMAQSLGASVTLGEGRHGRGLSVRVTLVAAPGMH